MMDIGEEAVIATAWMYQGPTIRGGLFAEVLLIGKLK